MAPRKFRPESNLARDVSASSDNIRVLEEGDMRLDALYYSDAVVRAWNVINHGPHQVVPLIDLCDDVFRLVRFKRIWSNKEHGFPYMAATDLFRFKPYREQEYPDTAYVAKGCHEEDAKIKSALKERSVIGSSISGERRFFVREGWILVSCSGSVGRMVLVTKSLSKTFFSHDLIRIVPKKETLVGYLYAYLSSWAGQTFLRRDEHGGWIRHIEPEQIKSIPVVCPPRNVQKRIHDRVVGAYGHREEFLQEEAAGIDQINSMLLRIENSLDG